MCRSRWGYTWLQRYGEAVGAVITRGQPWGARWATGGGAVDLVDTDGVCSMMGSGPACGAGLLATYQLFRDAFREAHVSVVPVDDIDVRFAVQEAEERLEQAGDVLMLGRHRHEHLVELRCGARVEGHGGVVCCMCVCVCVAVVGRVWLAGEHREKRDREEDCRVNTG